MLALLSLTTFVMADDWSKDQTAVWSVVTESWGDEVAGNGKWPSNYIHEDVVAWGASWPQPRDSASVTKWSRFDQQDGKTLIYELFPVAVVVVLVAPFAPWPEAAPGSVSAVSLRMPRWTVTGLALGSGF